MYDLTASAHFVVPNGPLSDSEVLVIPMYTLLNLHVCGHVAVSDHDKTKAKAIMF